MDGERRYRSGDHAYHNGYLESMLQELKALMQEWKDNTPSSMAEARRLINLDYIQEEDEELARSLADFFARDSEEAFEDDPVYPVQAFVSSAIDPDTDSFEQRVQTRLQQLVGDIRVTARRVGAGIDDSVSAAEEVLQDISRRRSQNKRKGKLVFDDEDSEFEEPGPYGLRSASTSSISSEEDKDGAHSRELCQICFESTPATSPFLRVEGALDFLHN